MYTFPDPTTLLEIGCDSPSMFPWLDIPDSKRTSRDEPPQTIFLSCHRVSFDEQVDVLEYQTLEKAATIDGLWWSQRELEDFLEESSSDDSESSMTSDSIAYNHTRRVLLHQECKGSTSRLRKVSQKSSKQSKAQARKRALEVAQEVDPYGTNLNLEGFFGWNPRVADFYIDSFLEMFTERNSPCGMLQLRE